MTKLDAQALETEALRQAAALMAASARTAPKTRGLDAVQTLLLEGSDCEQLAAAMEAHSEKALPHLAQIFIRDADNVRRSGSVLLVGVVGEAKVVNKPLDCGACGHASCRELMAARQGKGNDFVGPICIFQALDLGIALGSAVKMAGDLNVDNRIMYTVGVAAKKLGMLEADIIIGVPLSVSRKNIYFDRKAL